MRQRFGVVQDAAVHKYVTLVGAVLVTNSSRPNLPWTFIVLDTDAVNAFAAPGGFVHITKGALAMMANEAELAGVLGHELIHITEKHTIAYLKKSAATGLAMDASGKGDNKISAAVVGKMKDVVLQGFGRKEEMESDEKGLALANKAGYAPSGLGGFLQKLADRNKTSTEKRGLFASHPEMNDRIKKLGELAAKMNVDGHARGALQEVHLLPAEGDRRDRGRDGRLGRPRRRRWRREEGRGRTGQEGRRGQAGRGRAAEEKGLRALQALEFRRRRQETGAGHRIREAAEDSTPKSTPKAAAIPPSSRSR